MRVEEGKKRNLVLVKMHLQRGGQPRRSPVLRPQRMCASRITLKFPWRRWGFHL